MGIRIIAGEYDGDTSGAVLVCSTSMTAFGPIFADTQEADCFLNWWGDNFGETVRAVDSETLGERFATFRRLVVECSGCRECTVKPGGMCDDCVEMRREPAL